ncbi:MAG: hypothetical protein ACE5EB_02235 [Thermodesulfobacteriota bacterium]
MKARDHIIIGAAASGALYPALGLNTLWFFGASFLIDIDHYLDFIFHNGFSDLSLKGMFSYHRRLVRYWNSPAFLSLEVFHTVEFMAPLYLIAMALGSAALKAVFWGAMLHILLDMVFLLRHKIFFKRSHSIVGYFISKKGLKRRGYDPGGVYISAVESVADGGGGGGALTSNLTGDRRDV